MTFEYNNLATDCCINFVNSLKKKHRFIKFLPKGFHCSESWVYVRKDVRFKDGPEYVLSAIRQIIPNRYFHHLHFPLTDLAAFCVKKSLARSFLLNFVVWCIGMRWQINNDWLWLWSPWFRDMTSDQMNLYVRKPLIIANDRERVERCNYYKVFVSESKKFFIKEKL